MAIAGTKSLKTLNGVVFPKQPTALGIEKYDLSKSGRVSSGKMNIDIIAKKRKFTLVWDVISGTDMDILLAIVDSWQPFYTLVYIENDIEKTATVYSGAKKAQRFRTDGKWYWKNFTFDLIEQ